jgi:hypothetical protein
MVAAKVANSTTASTTVVKGDSSKLTSPVTTEEAEISQTTTKCRWKEVTIQQNTTTMSQEQTDEPTRLLWKMDHNERADLNMYGESGITSSSVPAAAEATAAVAVDFQEVASENEL